MAELQNLLKQNGNFKDDLMQAFLQAAQTSFREHARTGQQPPPNTSRSPGTEKMNRNFVKNSVQQMNVANDNQIVPGGDQGYSSSMSSPTSIKSASPLNDNNNPALSTMNIYNANQDMQIKLEPGEIQDVTLSADNIALSADNLNLNDSNVINNNTLVSSYSVPTPTISAAPSPQLPSPLMGFPLVPSPDTTLFEDEMRWDSLQAQLSIRSVSSNENEYDVDRILDHAKMIPTDARLELIKHYTEPIVDAHTSTTINLYKIVNEANEIYERKRMNNELPKVENLNLMKDKMWQQFKSNMVPEITNVVKFCKRLPGFSEVDQEDQIHLIKQGTFEVLLTRFCMLVDYEKGEMFDPAMKLKVSKEVVKQMPMGDFLLEFFTVAEMFNPLKLTDGEIGIFTAILIYSPDRDSLKNVPAVSKIRMLFEQILYYQLKSNHADPDRLFKGLLASIQNFRAVNARHSSAISAMKIHSKESFDPLHNEVFEAPAEKTT